MSAKFLINKSSRRKIKNAFLIGFTISSILTYSIIKSDSVKELSGQVQLAAVVYTHYFLVIYWYINGTIIVSTMETFSTELQVCKFHIITRMCRPDRFGKVVQFMKNRIQKVPRMQRKNLMRRKVPKYNFSFSNSL